MDCTVVYALILLCVFQYSFGGYCTYQTTCSKYSHRSCGTWGWSRCGYTKYYTCYSRHCCSGWGGSRCDKPICNNYCRNGGTCVRPNTCSCQIYYSGSYCQTKKSCVDKRQELFLLLDSSGSIGHTNFMELKDFAWNVSQVLDIAPSKTRVGLMTFSRFPIIRLNIMDVINKNQVLDVIKGLPYVPGLTETHTALSLLQREGYFGSRSNVPHIALLITEGTSLHTKETSDAAASLHSHGIQVFVVGIGKNVASSELRTIASDPDSGHLLTVDTYKQLPSIIEKLTTLICDVSAHSYTPLTTPKPILFQHTYGHPVPECIGKAADIVFVIDSTTTIGASHFKSVKRFALDIVNDFDIADNATRIGVITFSTYPLLRLELGNLNSKLDVLNFINNLVYYTGKRETDRALELLRIEGFLNRRKETPNIAILITDGPSTNSFLTTRVVDELKNSGVQVFVVGIGDKIDLQELGTISSDPKDHVFTVSNFDELGLSSFEGIVAKTICKDIPIFTTQSTTPSTSTTTQATTNAEMTSTRAPWLISGNKTSDCVPEMKDILFIVDSSSRVGEKNFMKVKTFMKQTVETFNIGLNKTRVGLILYNTNATLVFSLDEYNTSQDIQNAVDNITYIPANKTNTAQALKFARTQGFTYNRSTAPNIVFLITDGYSSNKTATKIQANMAQQNHLIQIVTIAVGQYVDFDELVDIATENPYTNKSLFYSVDDFDDLHVMSLENVLTSVICGFQILSTTSKTTTLTTTASTSTPCYDKVKNCDEYKLDMCTNYRPWAEAHCNQYCGFCEGTTTPGKPCLDTIDNCHEYGPNICNSTVFRKWSKDHCSHFCGFCGPQTTTNSIPSTPKFEIPTLPPKTLMPPLPSLMNTSCYDKVDDCDLYTQGMCSEYRPWAMEHCRMFCGFCTGTPTPVEHCVDTVSNCGEYGADLCTSLVYRRWTKQHCPQFCGFCAGGTTTSSAPSTDTLIPTRAAKTPETTSIIYSRSMDMTTELQRNITISTDNLKTTTNPCFDKLHLCEEIDHASCSNYKTWAIDNCRKHCGYCQDSPTSPTSMASPTLLTSQAICIDNIANCTNFVPDICTSASYRNWARENCAKYCNLCGNW